MRDFWFTCILLAFAFLDAWVGYRLLPLLRTARRRRLWEILLKAWLGGMYVTLIVQIEMSRFVSQDHHLIPQWFSISVYIWHLLILPVTALTLLIAGIINRIRAKVIRKKNPDAIVPGESPSITRRQMLALTAAAIPPLATFSLSGVAMAQLGEFRIKKYHLQLPGWPAALDGLTIAVVADIHIGVFTTPKMLNDIVERTNQLKPDLTLLAGDLINLSLTDLPAGLDMAARLDARYGVFMIQGNHDVIEDENTFNTKSQQRGIRLLLNEIETLRPRGIPIQLLGTKYPRPVSTRIDEDVAALADRRDPDLFPILLAHHPHSWDAARKNNLPLTIAGHTHGGQIMLTDHIGAGPIKFKYWTGLYQKDNTQLLVSNGVGNWFPLRMNAPAEIVHITMHPQSRA